VFRAFHRWLERRRRYRAATEVAIRHFQAARDAHVHTEVSGVIGEEGDGLVVVVCYDSGGKPPGRVWYRVEPNESVTSLEFDDVVKFGVRPWR
jgi:hypothetical protein